MKKYFQIGKAPPSSPQGFERKRRALNSKIRTHFAPSLPVGVGGRNAYYIFSPLSLSCGHISPHLLLLLRRRRRRRPPLLLTPLLLLPERALREGGKEGRKHYVITQVWPVGRREGDDASFLSPLGSFVRVRQLGKRHGGPIRLFLLIVLLWATCSE